MIHGLAKARHGAANIVCAEVHLAEVDSALSTAVLEAERGKVRADRLCSQIKSMRHHR